MASINGSTPLHLHTPASTGQPSPTRNGPAMAHAGNTGCMPGFKAIPRRLAQAIAGLCRGRQTHAPQSGATHAGTPDAPRRSSEQQRPGNVLASTSQAPEHIELPVFTTPEPNPLSEEILAVKNTVSTDQASLKDEVIATGSPKRLSAQSTLPDDGKGATAGAADNRRASTTSILGKRNSGLQLPQAQEDKGKGKAESAATSTPPGPSTSAAHQEPSGGVKETPEANDARDPLRALDTGINKVAKSLDSFADNYLQQIDDLGANLKSARNEMGGALDRYGNSLDQLGNTMDHLGETADRVDKLLVNLNQQLKAATQSLMRENEEMQARFDTEQDKPVEMTPELREIVESADAFVANIEKRQAKWASGDSNTQVSTSVADASTSDNAGSPESTPASNARPGTSPVE